MNEAQKKEVVFDAMRWVTQEAKALKLMGVTLPANSKLREALAALDAAYALPTT